MDMVVLFHTFHLKRTVIISVSVSYFRGIYMEVLLEQSICF